MFGYIRPYKPEMLVKEYELYRAVYCGLCRQLSRDYGVFVPLILTYDCTFLAIVSAALSEKSSVTLEKRRCVCNPLKKCSFCRFSGNHLEIAAAVSVISFYYKLKDNICDESFLKSIGAKLILPVAKLWRNKALKKFGDIDLIFSDMLKQQFEAEKNADCSVDCAAEPSCTMLSRLMIQFAASKEQEEIYSRFGYFLGRWIYLTDAVDDLEKDCKHGGFNPVLNKVSMQNLNPDEVLSYCTKILNQTAVHLIAACNSMDFYDFEPIIKNIICEGTSETQRRIILSKDKLKQKNKCKT